MYHAERLFSPALCSTSDLEVSVGLSKAEHTRHPQGSGQLPLLTECHLRTVVVLGRAEYFAASPLNSFRYAGREAELQKRTNTSVS